jgi:hypothetical protein
MLIKFNFVIPAKAGIKKSMNWTPAFAGVTNLISASLTKWVSFCFLALPGAGGAGGAEA